jgi:hypothetical protein
MVSIVTKSGGGVPRECGANPARAQDVWRLCGCGRYATNASKPEYPSSSSSRVGCNRESRVANLMEERGMSCLRKKSYIAVRTSWSYGVKKPCCPTASPHFHTLTIGRTRKPGCRTLTAGILPSTIPISERNPVIRSRVIASGLPTIWPVWPGMPAHHGTGWPK